MEVIIERAIPILDLDRVIVDRVKATSPENLELAIQGIVRSELQAIVRLGGILGFLIGVLQAGFFVLAKSASALNRDFNLRLTRQLAQVLAANQFSDIKDRTALQLCQPRNA